MWAFFPFFSFFLNIFLIILLTFSKWQHLCYYVFCELFSIECCICGEIIMGILYCFHGTSLMLAIMSPFLGLEDSHLFCRSSAFIQLQNKSCRGKRDCETVFFFCTYFILHTKWKEMSNPAPTIPPALPKKLIRLHLSSNAHVALINEKSCFKKIIVPSHLNYL